MYVCIIFYQDKNAQVSRFKMRWLPTQQTMKLMTILLPECFYKYPCIRTIY